jgi:hypothetical protein
MLSLLKLDYSHLEITLKKVVTLLENATDLQQFNLVGDTMKATVEDHIVLFLQKHKIQALHIGMFSRHHLYFR